VVCRDDVQACPRTLSTRTEWPDSQPCSGGHCTLSIPARAWAAHTCLGEYGHMTWTWPISVLHPCWGWGGVGVHIWLCIPRAFGAGPTLRSGKEVASLPDTELVFFLSLSLSSPIWLPGSTLDPHPQDQESPVLEEFHTGRGSRRHSNARA